MPLLAQRHLPIGLRHPRGMARDRVKGLKDKSKAAAFENDRSRGVNPSHPQQKSDISVVQLAEALIQGDVLIALQERGEAAPAWGYLNLLAHSDRTSLRRVRDFNQSRRPLSGWGTVVFDLIVDILNSAPSEDELTAAPAQGPGPPRAQDLGQPGDADDPPGSRHPRPQRPLPLHGTALI